MKKLTTLCLALVFALSGATVTYAARSVKCTVDSVAGATVTLDCGKKADKLAVGTVVKVKAARKKAIEGC